MTLNDFAKDMANRAGESTSDSSYISVIESFTKDSLAEMFDRTDWKYFTSNDSITLVVGTAIYPLPVGVTDVRSFRIMEGDDYIDYRSQEELAKRQLDLEQSGRPVFWWFEPPIVASDSVMIGGADILLQVRFWPKPNSVLTVDCNYVIDPTTLTSTARIPLAEYMLVILRFGVMSHMLMADKDNDGSDRYYQRFLSELDRKVKAENAKQVDNPALLPSDIPNRGRKRLAILDPGHYNN